jgi:tetratricopeptide (TPR) repeat protein
MEGRNDYLLINYLDRALEEKEMKEIEDLINTDAATRSQFRYLQLAVQAVEYVALYDQVAAVKEQYKAIQPSEVIAAHRPNTKRIALRTVYRVAACLLFVIVGMAAVKYATTTPAHAYKEAFVPYALPTSRSNDQSDDLERSFRNGNWHKVIAELNLMPAADNKALFLAGLANMELQQYDQAINLFQQVLTNNAHHNDDYFHDEAQYYQAMSYLATHQTNQALILLQQIRADNNHLYYQQVTRISSTEMRILTYKSRK